MNDDQELTSRAAEGGPSASAASSGSLRADCGPSAGRSRSDAPLSCRTRAACAPELGSAPPPVCTQCLAISERVQLRTRDDRYVHFAVNSQSRIPPVLSLYQAAAAETALDKVEAQNCERYAIIPVALYVAACTIRIEREGSQGPHLARRRACPADAFDQTASVAGDAERVRVPPSVRCTLPALAGVPLRHPRCRQPMPQASQLLWHGQGLHCAHRRHLDGPSSMLCGFSLQALSCA